MLTMKQPDEASSADALPRSTSSPYSASSPPRVDCVAPDTPSQLRRKREEEEDAQKQRDRIQRQNSGEGDGGVNNDDDDRCLICMNGFTKRQPAFKIPCTANCNDTFVHEKCVYEWKERQTGQGSCPLCRSPLKEMAYVPPDVLRSATFHIFAVRKDFISRPIDPQIGMVRMYIKVFKTVFTGAPCKFEIYLQAPTILKYPNGPLPRLSQQPTPGDQLLIVARKKFGLFRNRAVIELTLDRLGIDYERNSENFIGHMQCGISGLDHVGYPANGRGELVCVQYTQNRIGRGVGPRKMRVCFPKPEHDAAAAAAASQRSSNSREESEGDVEDFQRAFSPYRTGVHFVKQHKDTLSNLLKDNTLLEDEGTVAVSHPPANIIFAKNMEPYWLEAIMAFSLDFHGRVTLPSNKNFILTIPAGHRPEDAPAAPGDTAENNVCLQFGKVEESPFDCYTMDVAFPMSVLQAAMICLSACDRKLACA